MPNSGRFGALIKTRSFYTGESHRESKGKVRLDNSQPIPAAHADQQLLESQVFISLASIGDWYAHPLGIAGIYPQDQHGARISLDSHSELSDRTRRALAGVAAGKLLPSAEPAGEVGGIPGLRVDRIADRDLTVSLIGSHSRLTIRAAEGTRWTELIDRYRRRLGSEFVPLWDLPALSEYERQDSIDYADLIERRSAWLGSGLLRRVALFENASTAHTISSWTAADRLIFELESHPDAALAHDVFLDHLTNATWGLPLQVESSTCCCKPVIGHRSRGANTRVATQECRFDLRHKDGRPGVLQLRFHNGRVCYHPNLRTHLTRLGASTVWLDRTLPQSVSGVQAIGPRGSQHVRKVDRS